MEMLAGPIGVFIVLLALVVLVLWTFLPFAIFGMKPILRQILAEMRESNGKPAVPVQTEFGPAIIDEADRLRPPHPR